MGAAAAMMSRAAAGGGGGGGGGALSVSISPTGGSLTGTVNGNGSVIPTDTFTAVVSGAIGPTIAWTVLPGGNLTVTPQAPAAASTAFLVTVPNAYGIFSATVRVTVNGTATADMIVQHRNRITEGGYGTPEEVEA